MGRMNDVLVVITSYSGEDMDYMQLRKITAFYCICLLYGFGKVNPLQYTLSDYPYIIETGVGWR